MFLTIAPVSTVMAAAEIMSKIRTFLFRLVLARLAWPTKSNATITALARLPFPYPMVGSATNIATENALSAHALKDTNCPEATVSVPLLALTK